MTEGIMRLERRAVGYGDNVEVRESHAAPIDNPHANTAIAHVIAARGLTAEGERAWGR